MAWIRSYKTKNGDKYQVQWRDPCTGKVLYGKPQPYKSEANNFKKEKELELANSSSGMVLNIPNKITVQEVYDIFFPVYRDSVPEPRSAKIMEGTLNPFLKMFGTFPIQSISSPQLERFKNELLRTRASNGINFVIRYFKIFFKFAVTNGYLRNDPSKPIKQFKAKKVARFLTRDELCRLYMASSKKMRKAIFCLVYTGIRIGEFLNLKKEDISKHSLHVDGKTGERFVPLSNKVRRVIFARVGQYTCTGVEQAFRKAVLKLAVGRIRPHDLRHTFASNYLQCGGTLRDLQLILGHKSMAMMEVYAHFQRSYLEERMDAVRFPKSRKNTSSFKFKAA